MTHLLPPPKPLAGLRVLELARVLAGPWAGQILADLGADVVKVERPGTGDETRGWGPPFVDGPARDAGYFHAANRGKRSIAADLETEDGRALVHRLATRADILLENFKVGGLTRYGLDYPTLSAAHPRLVYCSITGFGQDGPYAQRAGYDFMIQGMGGIMSLTGEVGGEPVKTAVAFADIFTGVYASTAILAAIRARDETGRGCHVDMALLDTQVAVLANLGMVHLLDGTPPARVGNAHTSIVPYQVFPARDGHVIIACGNDGQFRRLSAVFGEAWADDPRFSANPGRVTHRAELVPLVADATRRWAKAELLAALEAATVPAGPINDLADVFSDPQVIHRGLVSRLPGVDGDVPTLHGPIVLDGARAVAARAAPRLDGDRASVLADPAWGGPVNR